MLYEKYARGTIDEVCDRLAQATTANGFGVLGAHDLKQKMAEKGVEFGPACRILEVCNPVQAKCALEANLSISTALPCRISVFERGGQVVVSTLRPTELLALFGNPELKAVARDVETTLLRIIDAACA